MADLFLQSLLKKESVAILPAQRKQKKNKTVEPNQIFELLRTEFGEVRCPLNYSQPHELVIAVILSAQCTDERVNLVTPELFRKFPTLKSFAEADPPSIEKLIFSTGFYRNKAKSISGFAKKLQNEYAGTLPNTIEELIPFPGIGRKTANVILNELFSISEGIVVDTHVKRISKILNLTENTDPVKIEKDLMKKFLPEQWMDISLYFIFLGRKYCTARIRNCAECPLKEVCPSSSNI
ncbi:MAG TPA: endonuclease III [Leptospiraceae bacterium]|nr:endonuclease III [Leptospiraceae bacterium]HMY65654.1 endonuclease III [Leptospiraceae bacterium]HMZ58187.1 endonuclease III [Leptospiraceae bacterium]HNF12310.1 endonuclease III [Leptospiraceae bacterium]HNM02066.1 endonuclease III [Leptospiraceae bacterium]